MQGVTWDVGIGITAAVLFVYSFFIRRHKALATLVSAYISFLVAQTWGGPLSQLFSGDRVIFSNVWIQGNITPFVVKIGLFVLLMIVLSTFMKLGGRRSRYGILEVAVYTICLVAVSLVFALLLMPEDMRITIASESVITKFLLQWKDWVQVVPVFAIVYFGIYGDEEN